MGRWKAEEWREKVNVVRFNLAGIPLEAREAGINDVRDFYGDPRTSCAACGTPLWHYWTFQRADGATVDIGQECAAIILGMTPYVFLRDAEERQAAEAAFARDEAHKAGLRSWWRSQENAALRRTLVVGARLERTLASLSEFYQKAYRAGRAGAISEKFLAWVDRASEDGVEVAIRRTAGGLMALRGLEGVRASRFDAPIIRDLADREFPLYDDRALWGSPLSAKQVALIEKLAVRYRKQLAGMTVKG